MIRGWTHLAFPCEEASRVGEARRHCARLAQELQWNEVQAGRLAIVVTELGGNLTRHAQRGRLLIGVRPHDATVEIISIDEGPGIASLQQSLRDGYSTGGTPGTGLGAVRRLANEFDIHSTRPGGTICVARVGPQPPAAGYVKPPATPLVGAVCLPAPGETECGDAWAAAIDGPQLRLLVADGLGHGPEAAKAALAAVEAFGAAPMEPLGRQLERMHASLRGTRGAATCLAALDAAGGTLRYVGAGNIAGRVLSGLADRSLSTQHGTVGMQMRRPEEAGADWVEHGMVILHSDGLNTRWSGDALVPLLQRDPTLAAALLLRDHTRQRDDATVVVVRRRDE